MKICRLIYKDFLLSGLYLAFSVLSLFIFIIFFNVQGTLIFSSAYVLLVSVSFTCMMFFNAIFLAEDKYKGNAYLVAIPYSKWNIVVAKYMLVLLVLVAGVICYLILELVSLSNIFSINSSLTFSAVAISFFVMSVVFSIFFPLYFRYSYSKIRGALFIVTVLIPIWGMMGLTFLIEDFNFIFYAPNLGGRAVALIAFGFIIVILSSRLSIKFLKEREF